jgi:hypothetical protein
MSRCSVLVSVAVLLVGGQAACGYERGVVLISGTTQDAATFTLSVVKPADTGIPDISMSAVIPGGTVALEVRNGLMPEIGMDNGPGNSISAKRVRMGGVPAIEVTGDPYDFQCWLSDGGDSVLLEPGVPVSLSGVTFTVWLPELGMAAPGGAVPAIGGVGLAVMVVLLIAVGGFVFSRVKRHAV